MRCRCTLSSGGPAGRAQLNYLVAQGSFAPQKSRGPLESTCILGSAQARTATRSTCQLIGSAERSAGREQPDLLGRTASTDL
eukprot:scaffold49424_cov61-Phaeocystis_antarctica.AAC.2